ncbi:trypsin-5-like [Anopheles maculipalpis]|uniref:trypsin-5-like n=1 Tax=Anopheles maculipalpis TaxID=1496333 RepID=UPI0021593B76|nr:trypsin-5-like [Anopheles maculipalpis]
MAQFCTEARLSVVLCIVFSSVLPIKSGAPSNRIVGGHVATIESYPYQVSVQELSVHVCGGSIITDRWILTAGHCVDDTIPRYMNVRVGSAFYNENGTVYGVEMAIPHPNHVPYSWIMDFALLQLNESLVFSTFVQPVALASHRNDQLYDRDCVVTGWGRTLNEEESFDQLRAVEIPLVSRELCNVTYEGKIDKSMICAGDYITGGKGSCAYDSGGPLVCAGVQVGIVSWGKGCALVGYPEVYSNVLYVEEWIDRVIKAL